MNPQSQKLADQLQAAGIPIGAAQSDKSESPWFVKVLLGFSGWLASLFIFAFLTLVLFGIIESADMSQPTGLLFVVAIIALACAYGLFRVAHNDFLEHMGLAVSLGGQLMIVTAIVVFVDDNPIDFFWFWIALSLIQLVLAVLMPNFIHRVVTLCFACLMFGVAMYKSGWSSAPASVPLLVLVGLWLNEFRFPRYTRAAQALGYGLALGVVFINLFMLFGWADDLLPDQKTLSPLWLGDGITLIALLILPIALFQRIDWRADPTVITFAFFASVMIGLLSLEVIGLVPGIVLLVLGFAVSNRLLMGLGLAALLAAISSYYYWLEVTLLVKAGILFGLGILLLLIRWGLVYGLDQEVNDAQ